MGFRAVVDLIAYDLVDHAVCNPAGRVRRRWGGAGLSIFERPLNAEQGGEKLILGNTAL